MNCHIFIFIMIIYVSLNIQHKLISDATINDYLQISNVFKDEANEADLRWLFCMYILHCWLKIGTCICKSFQHLKERHWALAERIYLENPIKLGKDLAWSGVERNFLDFPGLWATNVFNRFPKAWTLPSYLQFWRLSSTIFIYVYSFNYKWLRKSDSSNNVCYPGITSWSLHEPKRGQGEGAWAPLPSNGARPPQPWPGPV